MAGTIDTLANLPGRETSVKSLRILQSSLQNLNNQQAALDAGVKTFERNITEGRKQIEEAKQALAANKASLADGFKEWQENKATFDKEIADGQQKLADARATIDDTAGRKIRSRNDLHDFI